MTDVCGASSSSVCSSRSLRAATCSSGSWTSCTCCMHRQGGEPRGMLTKHHLKVDKVSIVFQRYQSLSNFGLCLVVLPISGVYQLKHMLETHGFELGNVSSHQLQVSLGQLSSHSSTSPDAPWQPWQWVGLNGCKLGNGQKKKKIYIYIYGQLRNGKDISVLKFFLLLLVIQER